jgi:hypothetical protein
MRLVTGVLMGIAARRLVPAMVIAALWALQPEDAEAQEREAGPFVGAALSLGEPIGERFGHATSLGVGAAVSGGYWVTRWFALETRARLLDINSDVGSPWVFDIGAGVRFSIGFGPMRVQPALTAAYAVLHERCVAIPAYGTACYGLADGQLTPSLLLGYRWRTHTFGVSAARSISFDHGQQWNTFSLEWAVTFGP